MITDILNLTDEIMDFAWQVQSNLETASYPMYQTRDELSNVFTRCLKHDEDRLLAWHADGELRGIICLWIEHENKYLQTGGVYISGDWAAFCNEFLPLLTDEYRGFELNVGVPAENTRAIQALLQHGAECLEASMFTKLTPDEFVPFAGTLDIQRVTESDFAAFAAFHDAKNLDMYWTAERVREKLDDWLVYAVWHNNCVVGCALCGVWADDSSEIYAVTLDDNLKSIENYRALQSVVASDVFESGKKAIIYMVENNSPIELEAALQAGFKITGNYRDYKAIV